MAPAPVIRLHPDDGVLIARASLPPGMVVADGVTTTERIPAGHKVAQRVAPGGFPPSAICRRAECGRPGPCSRPLPQVVPAYSHCFPR